MSSAVRVTDNNPLLFKALAWDNYYRTQFHDSPDERPEFNSMIYDKSSAEFKALLWQSGGVCMENVMDNKYSELVTDYNNNRESRCQKRRPNRDDNDDIPLLAQNLRWDLYHYHQFPDSPELRPAFNSQVYDESSAEFKALLFDAEKAHRNEWRDKIASDSTFNDEMAGHNENGTPTYR